MNRLIYQFDSKLLQTRHCTVSNTARMLLYDILLSAPTWLPCFHCFWFLTMIAFLLFLRTCFQASGDRQSFFFALLCPLMGVSTWIWEYILFDFWKRLWNFRCTCRAVKLINTSLESSSKHILSRALSSNVAVNIFAVSIILHPSWKRFFAKKNTFLSEFQAH